MILMNIYEMKSIKEATRPEFYRFMDQGLKTLLFGAYKATNSTYEQIVTMETSTKAKEGYPSVGGVGLPDKVLEGQPFPEKQIGQDDLVELTNCKFGRIISVTQELIDDDQTRQIIKMPTELGEGHKKQEDKSVYSLINSNAAIYDGSNFFAADHPGYTGGAAVGDNDNIYTNVTLSAGAIGMVLSMIALWKGHDSNEPIDVRARTILVPERLKYSANVLVHNQTLFGAGMAGTNLGGIANATGGSTPNPFIGDNLNVISTHRLDSTSTADWYIVTDFPGLVFQWRQKLKLMSENENSGVKFERDVLRWRSDARWAVGVVNWRCMLKVS
jgi:phage major head subunit gpT-like protein